MVFGRHKNKWFLHFFEFLILFIRNSGNYLTWFYGNWVTFNSKGFFTNFTEKLTKNRRFVSSHSNYFEQVTNQPLNKATAKFLTIFSSNSLSFLVSSFKFFSFFFVSNNENFYFTFLTKFVVSIVSFLKFPAAARFILFFFSFSLALRIFYLFYFFFEIFSFCLKSKRNLLGSSRLNCCAVDD